MTHLIPAVVLALGLTAAPDRLPAPIVEPYLRIQTALAADKTDGIKAEAVALAEAAKDLDEPAKIVTPARQLADAKDIEAARTAFGLLSEELVKRAGKSTDDLKIAQCPMTPKPWLQKGSEIRNPYFGGAMLTCGSIKS